MDDCDQPCPQLPEIRTVSRRLPADAGPLHPVIDAQVNLRADVESDLTMLAGNGFIAVYSSDDRDTISIPTRASMMKSARFQYILTYLTEQEAKLASVRAVNAAVAAGALTVGDQAGLPVLHYPLQRTADAHRASEEGVVGQVLVDVTPSTSGKQE